MSGTGNGHKDLLLKIALVLVGGFFSLLVGVVGFIGKKGLEKMDSLAEKIDTVNQGMVENRLRIVSLETDRQQTRQSWDALANELRRGRQ